MMMAIVDGIIILIFGRLLKSIILGLPVVSMGIEGMLLG